MAAMNTGQRTLARMYLGDPGTSAVQQIQIQSATGGTFTITYSGQTTAPIAYPAGAADVQNALCNLSNIGVGGVNVIENAGVPQSLFFVIYFAGTLGNLAQPMVTVDGSSLTGVAVLITITQITAGGVMVFSDDELDALYTDAFMNLDLAVALGWDVLAAFGAKFNDYVAGQTQEKKSQIQKNIVAQSQWWHQWANSSQQVQFVSLRNAPPRPTAVPVISGVPAVGLTYAPPYGNRLWGPFGRGRGPF